MVMHEMMMFVCGESGVKWDAMSMTRAYVALIVASIIRALIGLASFFATARHVCIDLSSL
jgi:hypothetical protein